MESTTQVGNRDSIYYRAHDFGGGHGRDYLFRRGRDRGDIFRLGSRGGYTSEDYVDSHNGDGGRGGYQGSLLPINAPRGFRNDLATISSLQLELHDLKVRFEEKETYCNRLKKEYDSLAAHHKQYVQDNVDLEVVQGQQRHREAVITAKEKIIANEKAWYERNFEKPRNLDDPKVKEHISRITDMFYELLQVKIQQTNALREEVATAQRKNEKLEEDNSKLLQEKDDLRSQLEAQQQ